VTVGSDGVGELPGGAADEPQLALNRATTTAAQARLTLRKIQKEGGPENRPRVISVRLDG